MKHLLNIKNIRIEGLEGGSYHPILNGIDLTLKRGEVLGLIGESGAGKSTLGLASMGYIRSGCRIAEGSIRFDGQELTRLSAGRRRRLRGRRIAYVAQSAAASFNPAHKLIHQFAEVPVQQGVMSYAEAERKAIHLYSRLNLPDPEKIGYRYPHQVSGGQLQRAMVAMAMAADPDLIIFDEPTTALDVTTQIEVLAAIKDVISQKNTAAIYITHDLAVVAQLADRIMVLRYGDMVEEGEAKALLENPREEYTRDLLSVRSLRKHRTLNIRRPHPLLEVADVHAAYASGKPVVQDIDFSVDRRKTVAVVGESGSGKTTLARIITGLLPPYQGRILFDGQELSPRLTDRGHDTLRRMQMIYQMPDVALNPKQKISKILGRPITFYGRGGGREKDARVRELLDMVELPASYMHRYPSELSGGEKQRICIARALAADPDLIICDEVTSALDQLVAEGVLKLLQRLQAELGVSYLFITHDLATVKAIADEIIVMLSGRIVEQGSRNEILKPPFHAYTERLLSSVPEMDPQWLDKLLEARDVA
jgi:peptide/nickel transport system ATP-binding protein